MQHDELGSLVDVLSGREGEPATDLEQGERKEWVRQAVAALPEQLRSAVQLGLLSRHEVSRSGRRAGGAGGNGEEPAPFGREAAGQGLGRYPGRAEQLNIDIGTLTFDCR